MVAGDLTLGELLIVTDPQDILVDREGKVEYSKPFFAPGRRIVTEKGVALKCSSDAKIPYKMFDEHFYGKPDDLLGVLVPVEINGSRQWDVVVDVQDIGALEVQHLTVEDACFWAGEQPDMFLLHHNKKAGQCVDIRSFYMGGAMDNVLEGQTFGLTGNRFGHVCHQRKSSARSVRVVTADGVSLVCTRNAPIATLSGLRSAQDLLGSVVFTSRHGICGTSRVISVTEVGLREVQHVYTSLV
jgi:hypothetical protein